jgi:AraC-like DNA-binding protein
MHLAIRLDDVPVRIFAGEDDEVGRSFTAVIAGARSRYYVRDATPAASVGVQFEPGGATALLGVPAAELAERHTDLDAVLRSLPAAPGLEPLRSCLVQATSLAARLAILEDALAARRDRVIEMHPAVRWALARFTADGSDERVGAVRADTGYSHRRFAELFRREVGLGPKVFCRLLRLQRALAQAGKTPLSEAALAAGYADQAHFTRELRAIGGVTPGAYLRAGPRQRNHVPMGRGGLHIPSRPGRIPLP